GGTRSGRSRSRGPSDAGDDHSGDGLPLGGEAGACLAGTGGGVAAGGEVPLLLEEVDQVVAAEGAEGGGGGVDGLGVFDGDADGGLVGEVAVADLADAGGCVPVGGDGVGDPAGAGDVEAGDGG